MAGGLARSDRPFLVMLALLCVMATAWFEGSYADALGDFWPSELRRGGLLRLLGGLAATLGGCLLIDLANDSGSVWPEIAVHVAIFGGLALLLGGAARLLMIDGMRYAGRKLQERLDDDDW